MDEADEADEVLTAPAEVAAPAEVVDWWCASGARRESQRLPHKL